MSDTLVIHPKDSSTVMLKYVYEGKGYDLIDNPNISEEELKEAIRTHERIIILGHGTSLGLAHPDAIRFHRPGPNGKIFIIDDSFASLFKNKNVISMWCWSDEYFRRNNIKGFHTGMIISEIGEADYVLGYCPLTKEELFNNMIHLSKCLSECLDKNPYEMQEYILSKYNGEDAISKFNRDNIIVLE